MDGIALISDLSRLLCPNLEAEIQWPIDLQLAEIPPISRQRLT
jgi:hypothetical protein